MEEELVAGGKKEFRKKGGALTITQISFVLEDPIHKVQLSSNKSGSLLRLKFKKYCKKKQSHVHA